MIEAIIKLGTNDKIGEDRVVVIVIISSSRSSVHMCSLLFIWAIIIIII